MAFYRVTAEEVRRKEIYHETENLCKTEPFLKEAIASTLERQQIILETDELSVPGSEKTEKSVVLVIDKKTMQAAMDHENGKVAVLNFASFTKPGGGVNYGKNAQEECISRISTLMQCISVKKCMDNFYLPHREMKYPLHNDDIIYSPDIVVIREDNDEQNLLPQDKWKKVDVISCAAPSFNKRPTNRYNPSDGDKPVQISSEELKKLLVKRIERIFEAAYVNGVDILIVGAFGCGAFKNPPEVVAEAFNAVIEKHSNWFKVIEFAIPGNNDNSRVFRKWFGGEDNEK